MSGKKPDLEKLRSIRYGGKTAGQARVRPLEGGAGYEIDHPDGRKEAVVRPAPVRATLKVSE